MQNMIAVIDKCVPTQMVDTTPWQRENTLGRKLHQKFRLLNWHHNPDDVSAGSFQQLIIAVLHRLARKAR